MSLSKQFSKDGSAFSFRFNLSKCLTLIFKALRPFETSGTARQTVERHVSGNFLNFCNTTARDSDFTTALLFIRTFHCAVLVSDSDALG